MLKSKAEYGQTGREYIDTNYLRDGKAMAKKKDIQVAGKNDSHSFTAGSMTDNIAPAELAGMKDMDIREADGERLADILEIEIDKDLSGTEKKKEFIRQIKNPYLYRQGEYIVKLSFADTEATLTDRLKEYIEHMAALEFHDS